MPFSTNDPNAFVALGIQSALGTPQTALAKLRYAKYLPGTSVDTQPTVAFIREGGDGHEWGAVYKQRHAAIGQIVVNARPEITGILLALLPGGATWDGASGPANHTFINGHASYPWATLYAYHPGSAITHMFSDVRFTGISIEGQSGEPWKLTLPFIAINPGGSFNTTLAVASYASEEFWKFTQGSYQNEAGLATGFTQFKLDVALQTQELQAGAVTLDEIPVFGKDTMLSVTQRFEDPTIYKKVAWGAGVVPTVSVPTGSFRAISAYGAGANLRTFDINLPLLGYQDDQLTQLDPAGQAVMQTITAKALKGATHSLVALLANAHASAYA